VQRRDFLKAGLVGAGGLMVGNSIWGRVFAAPANDAPGGVSSYGPLVEIDPVLGVWAPAGFMVREIARANSPVGLTGYVWPVFPDGAHVFPKAGGGWTLVVNSENPPGADVPFLEQVQDSLGGASAIDFDASGNITGARRILSGTRTNCAGGATPWGTWLSGEEFDETEHVPGSAPPPLAQHPSEAGQIWECDPTGQNPAQAWPLLGHFKHEAAAFDDLGRVYLTEDIGDGCLYRFTPAANANQAGSLGAGTLEAMKVTGSSTSWVTVADPTATNPAQSTRTQAQAAGATIFEGGEGCWFHEGVVYVTTKGDDRVWAHDVAAQTIEILYDSPPAGSHVLNGVDNIMASSHTDHIYVAEDGDDMELIVIEERSDLGGGLFAAPILRLEGRQQGLVGEPNPTPLPLESEITGPTITPDGTRLYFSSQREFVFGATYELQAPPGKLF